MHQHVHRNAGRALIAERSRPVSEQTRFRSVSSERPNAPLRGGAKFLAHAAFLKLRARAAKFNTSAMGSEQIISYKKGRRGAFLLGFRVFGRLKVWFSTLAVLGIFLQKTPVTCWLKAMLSTLIQERFLNHILRRFGIGTFFQPVFLKHLFQLKVKGQIAANHRPIRIGVQRGHIQIFERLARPH